MQKEGGGQKEIHELKKGPWKPEEDLLLTQYVETHGEGRWATVSKRSGLMRGGKSCRLRWKNYLRPNLKHGEMSEEEEDLIIRRLPGRTDNEVKNYWNTHLLKKYPQHCSIHKKRDRVSSSKSSTTSNNKRRKLVISQHSPNGCGGGSSDKQETFSTDNINIGSYSSGPESPQLAAATSSNGDDGEEAPVVVYENPSPQLLPPLEDSFSSIWVEEESFDGSGSDRYWSSWFQSLYFPADDLLMYPSLLPSFI